MLILLCIFILLISPLFLTHIERIQRHKTASHGIINHSADMREFYYRVEKTESQILQILNSSIPYPGCRYRFEAPSRSIVFSPELPDTSLDISYGIFITEHQGYCLLRIVQQNYLWEKNPYTFLQNEFWNHLLAAEPIPYIQQPSHQ